MIGLDTNILVRYFTRDDLFQFKKAQQLLERRLSVTQQGYISLATLLELVWVVQNAYGFSRDQVVQIVDDLSRARQLQLQQEQEVALALEDFRLHHRDFADTLISALNQAAGCATTLTFDRKASRLPGFELI